MLLPCNFFRNIAKVFRLSRADNIRTYLPLLKLHDYVRTTEWHRLARSFFPSVSFPSNFRLISHLSISLIQPSIPCNALPLPLPAFTTTLF
jgi:hypothetical protein